MYRQLPSGKPTRPPTPGSIPRPIFVARPVDRDNIIDVVPDSQPSNWHQAPPRPASPGDFSSPYARGTAPGDFASPYSYMAPPLNTTPPSARSGPSGPSTFPANFAAEYEKYRERHQSPSNFGFDVEPVDSNRVLVSIYGSRLIVALFFLGIILIGFSLEKVPDFLPYLLELLF